MTQLITTILIRVTITGIVSSVAVSVAKGSANSEIVNIGCGLLMILAFMQPISQIKLPNISSLFATSDISAEEIQETNMQTTMGSIGATLAQVMREHASEKGITCSFTVSMEKDESGVLQVGTVTAYYSAADRGRLTEIAEIIESDCAVGEERQVFIEK